MKDLIPSCEAVRSIDESGAASPTPRRCILSEGHPGPCRFFPQPMDTFVPGHERCVSPAVDVKFIDVTTGWELVDSFRSGQWVQLRAAGPDWPYVDVNGNRWVIDGYDGSSEGPTRARWRPYSLSRMEDPPVIVSRDQWQDAHASGWRGAAALLKEKAPLFSPRPAAAVDMLAQVLEKHAHDIEHGDRIGPPDCSGEPEALSGFDE